MLFSSCLCSIQKVCAPAVIFAIFCLSPSLLIVEVLFDLDTCSKCWIVISCIPYFTTVSPNRIVPKLPGVFRKHDIFCKWGFHEVLMHFPSFSFSAQMGLDILLMNFAQTAWQPKGGWRRKFPAKLDIENVTSRIPPINSQNNME